MCPKCVTPWGVAWATGFVALCFITEASSRRKSPSHQGETCSLKPYLVTSDAFTRMRGAGYASRPGWDTYARASQVSIGKIGNRMNTPRAVPPLPGCTCK
eukprot:scaffold4855_cov195-Amphora_coffeaeformis.AAC.18